LSGYHDKLPVLVRHMFETIAMDPGLAFTAERFAIIKEQLHRDYANVFFEDVYQVSFTYTDRVLNKFMYQIEDLLDALEDCTFDRFVQFVRGDLLASLQIECLVHGNITREEAEH
jgi:secreted Zn-dependent insulinase-like peptidase